MGFPPAANPFTEHTTDLFQAGLPGKKALISKRSKAKPRLGTPHKNWNLWVKSLLPGQQLCWVLISYSCFSGELLCPSNGLGSPLGHMSRQVLLPMFSGWMGVSMPTWSPSVWCCVSGRGCSHFCLPSSLSVGLSIPPFIIQPQQLQNCPDRLFCYDGEGFPKLC